MLELLETRVIGSFGQPMSEPTDAICMFLRAFGSRAFPITLWAFSLFKAPC